MTDLAAKLHAFFHGLFRRRPRRVALDALNGVTARLDELGLEQPSAKLALVRKAAEDILSAFHDPLPEPLAEKLLLFVAQLFDAEEIFKLPEFDWNARQPVSAYWDVTNALERQKRLLADFVGTMERIVLALCKCLDGIVSNAPKGAEEPDPDAITVPTRFLSVISKVPEAVERVCLAVYDEGLDAIDAFPKSRARLERNLIVASGGNPADGKATAKSLKYPTQLDVKSPEALVDLYLGGTVFKCLFEGEIGFSIPLETRFEHHHIVAGSGHGKTQTLQYLIASDLDAVARGERSVIVIDSQGDLIHKLSRLKVFAPGEALHDRIVLIDPTDVEWPVSLNLFDVGLERLKSYSQLDRERLTNSIIELYDFVLGTLLSAEMTQKQNVIFRYVTRLMLQIPDATIHTLRELMEPKSEEKFAGSIAKLTGTARRFFETEFGSSEFTQTRKQVLRRLWGILENQTFERMFAHPRSKLDLFGEMNAGKIILINTAKELLKETGTEIFGRFFIALIVQAAQERATLREKDRMPTIVYIDEAADYFDRNIGLILAQARKYKVGMVLAHQYLGQLEQKLQDAFAANTSIKFAGGVSNRDSRALAQMMYAAPEFLETQPKGSFAAHVRGATPAAISLKFPLGHLEGMEKMTDGEWRALRSEMRKRYAVQFRATDPEAEEPDDNEDGEIEEDADTRQEPPQSSGDQEPDPDDRAKPGW